MDTVQFGLKKYAALLFHQQLAFLVGLAQDLAGTWQHCIFIQYLRISVARNQTICYVQIQPRVSVYPPFIACNPLLGRKLGTFRLLFQASSAVRTVLLFKLGQLFYHLHQCEDCLCLIMLIGLRYIFLLVYLS